MILKNFKKRLFLLPLVSLFISNALYAERIVYPYISCNEQTKCDNQNETDKILNKISSVSKWTGAIGSLSTAATLNSESGKTIYFSTGIGDAIKYSEPFCASYDFLKNPSFENLTSTNAKFVVFYDENGEKLFSAKGPHSTKYYINLYSGLGTISSFSVAVLSRLISYFV